MSRTHQPARPCGLWGMRSLVCAALLVPLAVGAGIGAADDQPKTVLKTESFDRDPGWEGHNNRDRAGAYCRRSCRISATARRISPARRPGRWAGMSRGRRSRPSTPTRSAPDARRQAQRVRDSSPLTKTTAGGGIFFGFFRAEQPGAGGRPIGSLGLNMDSEHSGGRLAVRLITGKNQIVRHVHHAVPPRQVPSHADPQRRHALPVDARLRSRRCQRPAANSNSPSAATATSRASSRKARHPREPQGGGPPPLPQHVTTFTVDLPEGYRKQGTTFDHFGLMNMMKPGGSDDVSTSTI